MFKLFHRHQKEQDTENVFLIVGLGNPGKEYRSSRHNIGFMVIDQLAKDLEIKIRKVQNRCLVGSGLWEQKRIILAKPQTFMNLSGSTAASLLRFYKLSPEQLIVIHDDVDLPMGTMRLRASGSSGGHRGMDSIIENLHSQDFPRLRIGVGRPPGKMTTASYVLEGFLPSEFDLLEIMVKKSVEAVKAVLLEGVETAMNRYNGIKES
jgi:PTH1 family peptidyl-tRNA hydrolase